MAKKIVGYIKLQVPAGKANPSPPIGPALGQKGLKFVLFLWLPNADPGGSAPHFGFEVNTRHSSCPVQVERALPTSGFLALPYARLSLRASRR